MVGRLGCPEDVAAVVVFPASDEAACVLGSTHYVDVGMTDRTRVSEPGRGFGMR
jgi:NAD(P)-dependent dehydrogenase (short-subunit alcohol dehydrogenase family)